MRHSIRVDDILEMNDCSGKKYISVTTSELDESVKSEFIMDKRYRIPGDKLFLASVQPGDIVQVDVTNVHSDFMAVGEYTNILTATGPRVSLCRCGYGMVSDGYDVYCPNPHCGLTLSTKLKRLGSVEFFSRDEVGDYLPYITDDFTIGSVIGEELNFTKPFSMIYDPRFWGANYKSIEQVLLDKRPVITLATFLIESEFETFIDNCWHVTNSDTIEFRKISQFYNDMYEMTNRRCYSSERQNKLMSEFIWSLGIESLFPFHIEKLVNYEMCMELPCSPVISYIYALTNRGEMISELGFHPLEAENIYKEISRRWPELHDIFAAYSSVSDMEEIFKHMRHV